MKNLPVRKYIPIHYALPYRNKSHGEGKMVKRAVQGLVVIGVSYVGLQIVLGVFGFIASALSFLLPLGAVGATAYGAWQWLKRR